MHVSKVNLIRFSTGSPERLANPSFNPPTALADEVERGYWRQWNARNHGAIDAYNARIAEEGLPLARYRSF